MRFQRGESSQPGESARVRRVELYAEFCDVFLGRFQAAKEIPDRLTAAQKRELLEPLAPHMMQQGLRDISATEAASAIEGPLQLVTGARKFDPQFQTAA